jgi:23S rRNA pseudouridine2604 synthase
VHARPLERASRPATDFAAANYNASSVDRIPSMPEPVRLAKRLIELTGCSRREAEQYIEGGWVLVDGQVVDEPQFKVLEHTVELDPDAQLGPIEPATILMHKPVGFDADAGTKPAVALVTSAKRWPEDATGIRTLRRHFARLKAVLPLEREASGLQVYTQDGRLLRRIDEDGERIEQEYVVEVAGEIAPYGLHRLCHGLSFGGRALAPCKVSWQSENRLRFALKGVRPGQIKAVCAEVGLEALALKRIRIGRIPLAKMAVGEWRYLPAGERL